MRNSVKRSISAFSILVLTLCALALPTRAFAQVATQVQQVDARADVATNAQHSHTTATTITLPAGSGWIVVTGIDIGNCASGTAVTAAAATFITTTGLQGSPQYMVGSGVTAGQCQNPSPVLPATGLRASAANTAVTFVLPTFATNQTISANIYYYYSKTPQ